MALRSSGTIAGRPSGDSPKKESFAAPDTMESLGMLERLLKQAWAGAGRFVSSHPRSLSGIVILGLAGFGATAFGIAPLAPDAALLPRSLVTEEDRKSVV